MLLILLPVLLVITLVASPVLAKEHNNNQSGGPFQEVWDAVDDAVASLTQMIGDAVSGLQVMIAGEEAARIAGDTATANAAQAANDALRALLEAAIAAGDTATTNALQELIDDIELTPGPEGPKGEQGIQGIQGIQGLPGASSWTDGTGQVTTTVNVGIGTTSPTGAFEVTTGNSVTGEVLDQVQTTSGYAQLNRPDEWQSFTAGISASLIRLELLFQGNMVGSSPYVLSIHEGEGVAGTILHTETVAIPGQGWKSYTLSTFVNLIEGNKYTIRLQTTTNTGWLWTFGNPYPYGRGSYSASMDHAFKTFVAEPVPDFIVTSEGAIIVPRQTTGQRDALTAVNGMVIYNTLNNQFNFYENGGWVSKLLCSTGLKLAPRVINNW